MADSRRSRVTFGVLAVTVRPIMNALMAKRWSGSEKLPKDTGFIVCPNHITEIDPVVIGHFLFNHQVTPHFLAKASLFNVPIMGWILKATGQVPVDRTTAGANRSLEAARDAISAGGGIVVYPEGTLTRDPDLWPMKGRTGAARLALQTGAPVVPIAHWGAHEVFPRYAKRLYLFPRKTSRVVVGDPIDFADLAGKPITKTVLDTATERILDALTALVADLRQETPPAERWNPADKHQKSSGRDYDNPPEGTP
ncbi:1-acyl-sn-glycerol-3-phosphate acyltransferase [Arthrobacter sp. CAN_C5]|uniref:lysophospholipid acyltransferase family protein n=1 Tax=Arthrobacter sp. CAN_C5 TaxID=2760706 RepID=UPI001AE16AC6|nr:lysophospholipid acyltransferase family protein [Arthrobacter sp. CAN_C5]